MSERRPLFLVGFMGSGKSAVGRVVAARSGRRFIDVDAEIERDTGRSIPEIFAAEGEPGFRAIEYRVLLELGPPAGSVVATGGGLFAAARARRLIRGRGLSVWLDVPLAEARGRVGAAATRPLWPADDALAQRGLFERRRAVYALADLRLTASPGDAAEVAARVLALEDRIFR